MMSGSGPSPNSDPTTSQTENELLLLIEHGPVKNVRKLFAEVLTVPQELRQEIFYWPEERDFCEHIASIGRALDTLAAVHRTFLGQFKVLSNLRASFIQAPTEFFVAPMYFCDRALDSLLRSIQKVQNDIKDLFNDLDHLEAECLLRYRWTKKAFLEDKYPKDAAARQKSERQPDMDIKEQRVNLLAELNERIGLVRRGGTNMLSLLGRQWLPGYAPNTALHRPDVVLITEEGVNTSQENPSVDKGNGSAELDIEGSESLATPVPQRRTSIHSRLGKLGGPVEVPETPEAPRTGGVVVTQRSSPRKRKPSQSSGRSEATESAAHAQNVARNLIRDSPLDPQDSPAPKSGASIEAIRAASQRDEDAATTRDRVEEQGDLLVRSQAALCLPLGSNRPASSKEPPSDTRMVFRNPSQDQEKHEEEKLRSLSI